MTDKKTPKKTKREKKTENTDKKMVVEHGDGDVPAEPFKGTKRKKDAPGTVDNEKGTKEGTDSRKKSKNGGDMANAEQSSKQKPTPKAPAPDLRGEKVVAVKRSNKSHPESAKKSKKPKPIPKAPTPSPEPEPLNSDAEADVGSEEDNTSEDSDDSDEGHLHGFSTDEDDSSDEDDIIAAEHPGIDISRLPTIAKDDATVKRKLEKAKRQPVREPVRIASVTFHHSNVSGHIC